MRASLKTFSVLAFIVTVRRLMTQEGLLRSMTDARLLSSADNPAVAFPLLCWDQIRTALGPIYDYLILPVIQVFEDPGFRATIVWTLTWACIVVAGLVFMIYEWPNLLALVTASSQPRAKTAPAAEGQGTRTARATVTSQPTRSSQSAPAAPSVQEPQRRTWSAWSETPKPAEKPAPQARTAPLPVQESGVKIASIVEKRMDDYVLTVHVINTTTASIAMVVVDLLLPLGIDMSVGSFRMQRIGTVSGGTERTATFKIKNQGGDLRAISGTVEFLSPGQDVSKVSIPPPEVGELQ